MAQQIYNDLVALIENVEEHAPPGPPTDQLLALLNEARELMEEHMP